MLIVTEFSLVSDEKIEISKPQDKYTKPHFQAHKNMREVAGIFFSSTRFDQMRTKMKGQ
jgi:hypothetical protein